MWRAPQGAFGLAEATDQPGIYEIVYMQRVFPYVIFQSTGARSPSIKFVHATVLNSFGHGNLSIPVDNQGRFLVWDEQDLFLDIINGSKGIAIYDEKNDKYRMVIAEQIVLFATALTDSALDGFTGTIIESSFLPINIALFNKTPPTIPTTVNNPFNHKCASNKTVLLMRRSGVWTVIDVEKQTLGVITSLSIPTNKDFLQGNVVQCAVETANLSGTLTNLLPLSTCSIP
jgi:hypothetical protein